MKLGVLLPQHDADGKILLDAARYAEASGLDSVWVVDHLHGLPEPTRPVLECWTSLAAVISATSRVTAGTLVLRVGLRLPAVVASMVRSASEVSEGRFIAGLGIGDAISIPEQRAYGIGWKKKSERLAELDHLIELLQAISPPPTVWLGGATAELVDRAARVQGLNLWARLDRMPGLLEVAERRSPDTEVSWGGNWPGEEGLAELEKMGVSHAIVATGATNYRARIDALASFGRGRGYPPGV